MRRAAGETDAQHRYFIGHNRPFFEKCNFNVKLATVGTRQAFRLRPIMTAFESRPVGERRTNEAQIAFLGVPFCYSGRFSDARR